MLSSYDLLFKGKNNSIFLIKNKLVKAKEFCQPKVAKLSRNRG